MRVLIFHGYLLRGTGSNVYNASVASALAGLGHDVHLLCQDRGGRASRLDRRRRHLERERLRRRPGGRLQPRRRHGHRLPPRHRRPAPRLRRRPLRGLRGQDLLRPERGRARQLHRRQRRRRPRRRRRARRHRRRALQPSRDGAADPRPLRARALRLQGPRQRPLLHGDPRSPVPAALDRGHGRRLRRARRLPPHGRVPVGDARAARPEGEDAARPARRRHRGLRRPRGRRPAGDHPAASPTASARRRSTRPSPPRRSRTPSPATRARRPSRSITSPPPRAPASSSSARRSSPRAATCCSPPGRWSSPPTRARAC